MSFSSVEEKSGRSFLVSIAIHGFFFILILWGGYLIPSKRIQLGTGPGGGMSADISTIGVVEEFSGGAGMIKPSIVPKPPALLEEKPPVDQSKAVPLPETFKPPKSAKQRDLKQAAKPDPKSSIIPTAPEFGSGGTGGGSGGSGGGVGGGSGVSIGTGSGGFGDHWYVRRVEARISSNWLLRLPEGVRAEMTYSFFIAPNGTITGIKQEKSSGNAELDLTAESAIRASTPLAPPPPEFRGSFIQFIAHFVYPPSP
jgi:TonB family protein